MTCPDSQSFFFILMVRRTIQANDTSYLVAMDDSPPSGARFWAVACAQALDELTAQPLTTRIRVRTNYAGLEPVSERTDWSAWWVFPVRCFPR